MPDASPPANAPIFGSFTLLAKLARGDIGDLFLARSLGAGGFEKLVVIKRIHPNFTSDPEIAQLFLEEARTAARVEHPNVRIVYEIGKNQEHYYIALEYLEGVPLVDVLLGRRRDARLADSRLFVGLLAQACQGLHAAHTLQAPGGGLVHGDINPRSIFVTAAGTTKILDFDIVEMRGALASRHGFMRRTNAYLSPEEVSTGVCDQLGDIFSLGVVAWECLTGRRLFKQKTRDATLAAISHGEVPSAKSMRPELSDELNATVMRALCRDPSLRFQTASEFGTALERAALAEGPPLTPVNIAALLQSSFSTELGSQKEFVRNARSGRGPELTAQHEISEHAAETKVAPDPQALLNATLEDDWGTQDEAATRIVEYDESLNIAEQANQVRNENPFQDVSDSADYSLNENTPGFQDTRNLVLAELGAVPDDYDDDDLPAAVRLERAEPAYQTPSPQQQAYHTPSPQQQPYNTPPPQQQPYNTPPPQQQAYNTPPPQQQAYNTSPPQEQAYNTPPPQQQAYQSPPPQQQAYQSPAPQGVSTPPPGYSTPLPPAYVTPVPPSQQTPEYPTLAPQGSYGDHSSLPRMPSTLDPTVTRSGSTADPNDQRFSTIDSGSGTQKPSRKAKKARAAAKRGKKKKSKKPLIFLLLLIVLGSAAAATLYVLKNHKMTQTASTEQPRDIQEAVAEPPIPNKAAGTAESILKAANQNTDAGPEAADDDAGQAEQAALDDNIDAGTEVADVDAEPDAGTEVADLPVEDPPVEDPPKNEKITKKPITKRPKKPPPRKPVNKGPGFLTVSSTPYATVYVDGKKKGFTPIVKMKLAPGAHRLKLVNSVDGAQKKMSVRIVSGGEIRRLVKF